MITLVRRTQLYVLAALLALAASGCTRTTAGYLRDPGRPPRRALHYEVPAGVTEFVRTKIERVDCADCAEQGVEPHPVQAPDIIITGSVSTALESSHRIISKVTKVEVATSPRWSDAVIDAMRRTLQPAEGFTAVANSKGRGYLDRNATTAIAAIWTLDAPREMEGNIPVWIAQDSWRAIGLPQKAVGLGARWQFHAATTVVKRPFEAIIAGELVELAGDEGTVRYSITVPPVEFGPEGVRPRGLDVLLYSVSLTGEGEARFSRRRITPKSSTLNLTTTYEVQIIGERPRRGRFVARWRIQQEAVPGS